MSKTIKILTPDNVEIEYSLASVGIRAAAAGIDLLIHFLVLSVSGGIAAYILYYTNADENTVYTTMAVLLLIYGFLNYGYFVLCDLLMKGQTIGKKIYHIRIIRDNGEGITFTHAMIREFIRVTVDPIGIGFITIFFSKKNKRVGDMLASTIVVEEEKRKLTYLDITSETINRYPLTKEEIALLKDFFARKEDLKLQVKVDLEQRLVQYFKKRFDIEVSDGGNEQFLKDLLQ